MEIPKAIEVLTRLLNHTERTAELAKSSEHQEHIALVAQMEVDALRVALGVMVSAAETLGQTE